MRDIRILLLSMLAVAAITFGVPRYSFADDPAQTQAAETPAAVPLEVPNDPDLNFKRHAGELYQVLWYVYERYVDVPNSEEIIRSAIDGIIKKLDPHSSYLSTKEYKEFQRQTTRTFGGVGMELSEVDGTIKVVAPIDGTPAKRAGIRAGDIITEVDGTSVQGQTLKDVVDKLRGDPNTTVTITVIRSTSEKQSFTLRRAIVKVQSVQSEITGNDVGYIRLSQFSEASSGQLLQAIAQIAVKAEQQKLTIKGYVLDVRNNPGGLLNEAVTISDSFLRSGVIVSTKGRIEQEDQKFEVQLKDNDVDVIGNKPLIVLINGGSASASEIVAGALQDHGRATVLGTRSFGKGSVQTIVPIGDMFGQLGSLRLTTKRYYTPSGRTIQALGITPDIEVLQDVPETLKGKDSIQGEASLEGHLKTGNAEQRGSQAYVPTDPAQDKALQTALGLIRGSVRNPAFPSKPVTPKPVTH